jgi:hypothetical protein
METLKFIVNGQNIVLDPNCENANLVPGTSGYIQAEFSFSKEWDGCAKVAAFYSNLGREFAPRILKDGKVCEIPVEALKKSIFKVKVLGQKADYSICTNKITIYQRGGKT